MDNKTASFVIHSLLITLIFSYNSIQVNPTQVSPTQVSLTQVSHIQVSQTQVSPIQGLCRHKWKLGHDVTKYEEKKVKIL